MDSDSVSVLQELQILLPGIQIHGRTHISQQIQPKRRPKECIASKGQLYDSSLFLEYSLKSTRVHEKRMFIFSMLTSTR